MLDLYLDTETSGLWRESLPLDDPSQPHAIEIAATLWREDECLSTFSCLVKPEGWENEPEALLAHSITTTVAARYGLPLFLAMAVLKELVNRADRIIGFNLHGFDRKVLWSELRRLGAEPRWFIARAANDFVDVMELAAAALKIPGQYGDYRWPSLEEAHKALLPHVAWNPRHRALDDCLSCRRVHRALMEKP